MLGRSTGAAAAPLLFLIVSVVAGCGSDGSTQSADEPTQYGTCDMRASAHECLEITSTEKRMVNEEKSCSEVSGDWTKDTAECPTDPDLIGCCSYYAGDGLYLECSYAGADDPKAECENEIHGYWQPAGL
ncbi:MAG TPA: hypothetical protein VF103_10840 [Polyangiaceae bacterium]